jgi:AcrR family transcriptional regulator
MAAKRKPKSPNLTAERIREEALSLIDADGIEAFSTRKLGAALGCEAMAIYWYYPSKDALLDAVVETLVTKLPLEPANPNDWIDAFRKLAHAYRGLAHQHPRSFPLLATRRFATESTYRFLEGLFSLSRAHGLDDRTTARFFRAVSSYCSGVALNELAGLNEQEKDAAKKRAAFPHIAAVWPWLEPDHYDDVFEFGLEVLLDALRAAAGASDARRERPSAAARGKKR